MARGIIPETIVFEGECYSRYTCRYMSDAQARQKVESLFAEGEIDHTDNPIIHQRAIYLKGV